MQAHAKRNALREAGEAEPKPDERAEGGAVPPPVVQAAQS
jgi:hypothetical protein